MSKYNRRKENPAVVSTDEFVSFWQKAFQKVQPFARAIGWSLLGFVGVVGAVAGVTTWMESRAEGATEAFGHVVRLYDAELLTDAPKPETKPPEATEQVTRYKTVKEKAEATLAELDKLPPAAARNAKLFRAGVLYDLERFDEARAAYLAAAEGATPAIATVAREGAALCLEQANKLDEAIAAYEAIAPKGDKATEFYRDRALLGAGRLLEKKGDKAQAIERYKELIAKFPTSSLKEDAQNRLGVLESQ